MSNLKRRQTCLANPQEFDADAQEYDVEQQAAASTGRLSSFELDEKSKAAAAAAAYAYDDYSAATGRRSVEFLSDLSPLSRSIVQFVTSSNRPVAFPSRCTSELARILLSITALLVFPFLIWDGYPGTINIYPLIRHAEMVWSSLLHTSIFTVAMGTFIAVAVLPSGREIKPNKLLLLKGNNNADKLNVVLSDVKVNILQSNWKTSLVLAIIFTTFGLLHMTLQMGFPHILWNPFMWGLYHVYLPSNISKSLQGACLDFDKNPASSRRPLCLSEEQWIELSSGQLSSYNPDDVFSVQKGLDYLQNHSGGIIINALARNVADAIPALKENMAGLAPFFRDSQHKLSLVIFENDSKDGTRQELKVWADQESSRESPRYTVDLMSCGSKNPDCELGIVDRYDNVNLLKNPNSSGVGKLGHFRQTLLDYILNKDEYNDYSHMVILDVDLGVSISPLGLLHTLGLENNLAQHYAVASSSSQVWPGTMGTIIPPYDLSAFRPKETAGNEKLREMHESFCHLTPAGDRWRNICYAASPMQLFMIQSSNDISITNQEPYEVVSAFNGVSLYPISIIRERGEQAQYDAGDDGQRCEHVGFHLSLQREMFVNPKWSMNLRPDKPGGPTGIRAVKTLVYVVIGRPNVTAYMMVCNTVIFFIAVFACWILGSSVKNIIQLHKSTISQFRRSDLVEERTF